MLEVKFVEPVTENYSVTEVEPAVLPEALRNRVRKGDLRDF